MSVFCTSIVIVVDAPRTMALAAFSYRIARSHATDDCATDNRFPSDVDNLDGVRRPLKDFGANALGYMKVSELNSKRGQTANEAFDLQYEYSD
jgi:hypothetical protein